MQIPLTKTPPLHNEVNSSSSFSQELIEQTIQIFKEENGILLSEEGAVMALNNLAGVFLAYFKKKVEKVEIIKK